MKALVYEGIRTVSVREAEKPKIREGHALVRVSYSGICGSDISIFAGKHPRAAAPLIIGHEFSGTVEETGENVNLNRGDKVVLFPLISCGTCLACRSGSGHVCNTLRLIGIDKDGGTAEYALVPADHLITYSPELPEDIAALIEPLAVVIHGVHQSAFKALDNVAILGAGPIGMLFGIVIKNLGAANVFISEIDGSRLEMCAKLGLHPIDAKDTDIEKYIQDHTNGEGADVVAECSGSQTAADQMTGAVRVRGTILILSNYKEKALVDLRQVNFKEINIVSSRVYTKREFIQAAAYASAIKSEMAKLISHKVPVSDSARVFDILADRNEKALKVLVDCGGVHK